MEKEKYDSIVRPFAIARQAPFLKNPKYSHLVEEPKEILISSAYYKNMWWYDELEENIKLMLRGEKAGVFFLDYAIAIKHGIKTKKLIGRDKQKMDMISFQQEYENIPFGENSDAFFKYEMFSENRDLTNVFYPIRKDMIGKRNPFKMPRKDGEIRVVSADIAARKGRENDNTVITCIRGIPTKKGYIREYVYMESHHGEHTGKQALRIKQIYNDFDADYIVLDLQNVGITLFERLATLTKDEERGVEYEAYTVYEHKSLKKTLIEELKEKTLVRNAKPIIYPISADKGLNSDIAMNFRDVLTRQMVSIPIDVSEADEYLNEYNEDFSKTSDVNLKSWYLHPYIELSYMVNETINLSFSMVGGDVVLKEPRGARKDRYTSASYGGYFITLLENDLLKQYETSSESDPLVYFF